MPPGCRVHLDRAGDDRGNGKVPPCFLGSTRPQAETRSLGSTFDAGRGGPGHRLVRLSATGNPPATWAIQVEPAVRSGALNQSGAARLATTRAFRLGTQRSVGSVGSVGFGAFGYALPAQHAPFRACSNCKLPVREIETELDSEPAEIGRQPPELPAQNVGLGGPVPRSLPAPPLVRGKVPIEGVE